MALWNKIISGTNVEIGDDFREKDNPKLKFQSTVSFDSRLGTGTLGSGFGSDNMKDIQFAVKQLTRPNITISYTDINFYGYRSKVATKTDYGVVTLTFYDDNKNRAHAIFKGYLNAVSPISNTPKDSAGTLESSRPKTIGSIDNVHGIINHVRITHHYADKKTHYDYLNPKLQNVILDELDMTQSDSSTISLTFVYDAVNVVEE